MVGQRSRGARLEGDIVAFGARIEGVDGGEKRVSVQTAAAIYWHIGNDSRAILEDLEVAENLGCDRA